MWDRSTPCCFSNSCERKLIVLPVVWCIFKVPPPEIRVKTTSGWEALLKPGLSNTQQTCRIGMTSTLEIICQTFSWATLPPTNFSSSRCCCSSDMPPMWWKGGLFWSHVWRTWRMCYSILNMISLYRYIPNISICEGRCNFQSIMFGIYSYFRGCHHHSVTYSDRFQRIWETSNTKQDTILEVVGLFIFCSSLPNISVQHVWSTVTPISIYKILTGLLKKRLEPWILGKRLGFPEGIDSNEQLELVGGFDFPDFQLFRVSFLGVRWWPPDPKIQKNQYG